MKCCSACVISKKNWKERSEDGNFWRGRKNVFREFVHRACNVYFCKGWGVFIILKCKNTKERNCKLFFVMYTYHFHLLVHSLILKDQIIISHQIILWIINQYRSWMNTSFNDSINNFHLWYHKVTNRKFHACWTHNLSISWKQLSYSFSV